MPSSYSRLPVMTQVGRAALRFLHGVLPRRRLQLLHVVISHLTTRREAGKVCSGEMNLLSRFLSLAPYKVRRQIQMVLPAADLPEGISEENHSPRLQGRAPARREVGKPVPLACCAGWPTRPFCRRQAGPPWLSCSFVHNCIFPEVELPPSRDLCEVSQTVAGL